MPAAQKKTPEAADVFVPETQRHLKNVVEQYQRNLRKHPKAARYLLDLGVVGQTVDDLCIGFGAGQLLRSLPSRSTPEGKATFARLQSLGLITAAGREALHGYITIPAVDENGLICGLYGRRISKNGNRPEEVFLMSGPGTLNSRALTQETVIICDSVFDFLSLYSAGVHHCIYTNDPEMKMRPGALLLSDLLPGQSASDILKEKGAEFLAALVKQRLAEVAGSEDRDATAGAPEDIQHVAARHGLNIQGQRIFSTKGERKYRIDGLFRNRGELTLAVVLEARLMQDAFTDSLNLFSSKERDRLARRLSERFECEEKVIALDLETLTADLRAIHDRILAEQEKPQEKPVFAMSAARESAAREFGTAPDLFERLLVDFAGCGLVREGELATILYVIMTSRLLDKPLHGVVRSDSAAGKSTLLDLISAFCPPEQLLLIQSMSKMALNYEKDISNMLLLIDEDMGVKDAEFSLKLLRSQGVLRRWTLARDEKGGEQRPVQLETPCKSATLMGSTATDGSEEEDNRLLTVTMDESKEQTAAILAAQRLRETPAGWRELAGRDAIVERQRDFQRLLLPQRVGNPFALLLESMTDRHRFRREQPKLLGFIRAITLIHQMQREVCSWDCEGNTEEFLLATVDDNVRGVELLLPVLGRTLDEMQPHTRKFMLKFHECIQGRSEAESRLLARDLSRASGLSRPQVWRHIRTLIELDWARPAKDVHGRPAYRLLWDGEGLDGERFLPGISDLKKLRGRLEEFEKLCREHAKKSGHAWWDLPDAGQIVQKMAG